MGRVVEGDPALPLLAELKRLTLVLAPGVGGYEYLPVDIALQKQVINAEDWTEAEKARAGVSLTGLDYVLGCYGALRFFRDVDDGRSFRESASIVSAVLDWAATEGFADMLARYSHDGVAPYTTPREYRQRFVLRALKRLEG